MRVRLLVLSPAERARIPRRPPPCRAAPHEEQQPSSRAWPFSVGQQRQHPRTALAIPFAFADRFTTWRAVANEYKGIGIVVVVVIVAPLEGGARRARAKKRVAAAAAAEAAERAVIAREQQALAKEEAALLAAEEAELAAEEAAFEAELAASARAALNGCGPPVGSLKMPGPNQASVGMPATKVAYQLPMPPGCLPVRLAPSPAYCAPLRHPASSHVTATRHRRLGATHKCRGPARKLGRSEHRFTVDAQ